MGLFFGGLSLSGEISVYFWYLVYFSRTRAMVEEENKRALFFSDAALFSFWSCGWGSPPPMNPLDEFLFFLL